MTIVREDFFIIPDVTAQNLRPTFRNVLCRVEQVSVRETGIWTPFHRTQESLGFVVYGRVVKAGPGDYEPVWIKDPFDGKLVRDGQQRRLDSQGRVTAAKPVTKHWRRNPNGTDHVEDRVYAGKLVWKPTQVKPGQRIVWAHGWGPKMELRDGVYFMVHEAGILAEWDLAHVHDWRLVVGLGSGPARESVTIEAECVGGGDCGEPRVTSRERMVELFGAPGGGWRLLENVESHDPVSPVIQMDEDYDPQGVENEGEDESESDGVLRRLGD